MSDREIKKLQRELNEELKRHVTKEQIIKVSPKDNEYLKYYDGVKKGINDKIMYNLDDATKTNYTKTKKIITKYDDEGKALIKTYLTKVRKPTDEKVMVAKAARPINYNMKDMYEKYRAFIKHDRMLNEIRPDDPTGISKAMSALGVYLRSPMYIPAAITVYSLLLNIKPSALVEEFKSNNMFMGYLKQTGYYDVLMSMIDKEYVSDNIDKTQIIKPLGGI